MAAVRDAWFRAVVAKLRKEAAPLLPVRVYIRDELPAWGLTHLSDGKHKRFSIEVRRAHRQIMTDTLLHEWAHTLAWRQSDLICDHGHEWGLAMSQVYQCFHL